jgi:hypothetical protein
MSHAKGEVNFNFHLLSDLGLYIENGGIIHSCFATRTTLRFCGSLFKKKKPWTPLR